MDDDDLFELCGLSSNDFGDVEDAEETEVAIKPTLSNAAQHSRTLAEDKPSTRSPLPTALLQLPSSQLFPKMQSSPATPSLGLTKALDKMEITAAEAAEFCLSPRCASWALAHACVSCSDDLAGLDAFCLDGILTDSECDTLVTAAESSGRLSFWSSDKSASDFRNADTIEMTLPGFAAELWARVEPFLQGQGASTLEISEAETPQRWERDIAGTWDASGTNECLLISRYDSGGHFAPHTDGYSVVNLNERSMYSMIIYLNDCCTPGPGDGGTRFYKDEAKGSLRREQPDSGGTEEGGGDGSQAVASASEDSVDSKEPGRSEGEIGESAVSSGGLTSGGRFTADPDLEICTVAARRGRVLVFYHNHMHEGTPPALGFQKYIIRSDVMYSRRQPICTSPKDQEAYALYQEAVDLAGVKGREADALPLFRRAFSMSRSLADLYGI
mmetsp:Transcript_64824/g.130353  ORF Transcript_64824/g.130353 Transcript_64824/m.130353 type:complete len:443 (+) Transcript_64824:101-1429(+)